MKTKMTALYFNFLPADPHLGFFTRHFLPALDASAEVSTIVAPLRPELNEWLEKERTLARWVRRSEYTKKIEEANTRLDTACTAFWSQVRSAAFYADTAMHDAAERLDIVRRNYGHVQRKPYETKTTDIITILEKLEPGGECSDDVATLGLAIWIIPIRAAYNDFNTLLHARNNERINKPNYTFRQVRRGLENVYHRAIRLIEAGALMGNSTEACRQFIEKISVPIEYLNAQYYNTRQDIATAEPEAIEPLPFTGQPLTPTPKVYYVNPQQDVVPLELGRDYNFTYRNNRKPGIAQCILHGKGHYKGRKTVTFIITDSTIR
jgi:hypothetical protein